MSENQDFYTDALQAFDVPAAPQKETAVETETLPAPAPGKKKRPRWVKLLCCILCAALLVGGGLAIWLEYRPLPDTDPNAPFQDLSDRTKEKIKVAATEYYHRSHHGERFWYGDPPPDDWQDPLEYGMRYYGTFGGYHIVLAPIPSVIGMPQTRVIDGYRFSWTDSFHIYAYKDGKVMKLEDAYELGLISKSQLDMIYQCFEQYNHEVYLGKNA